MRFITNNHVRKSNKRCILNNIENCTNRCQSDEGVENFIACAINKIALFIKMAKQL